MAPDTSRMIVNVPCSARVHVDEPCELGILADREEDGYLGARQPMITRRLGQANRAHRMN